MNSGFLAIALDEIFYSGSMPRWKKYLIDNKSTNFVVYLLFLVDIILRGISQVYLCDNPVSGIFICIALGITSMSLLGYALLGTLFATLGAFIVATPPIADITSGL